MPYIANTAEDQKEMLKFIGCNSFDELWQKVEINSKMPTYSYMPTGRSEFEVIKIAKELASKNNTHLVNFVGAGFYDHIIPATIGNLTTRGEFQTAYTPYQAEGSQGTLQYIYEYQTAICRLTGMEVSNASLYEGGTALFEAVMMAVRSTRKRRAIVSGAVSPIYRKMLECYCSNLNVELVLIPEDEVSSNPKAILNALNDKTACVVVQYPNVFGTIEDWTEVIAETHAKKALAICSTYPIALGLLKTPGEMGFDIVTAEGQSLGIPLSFGGPYLGIMATTEKHMRKMPGRICGRTEDTEGKQGFVLTLQAREQHIRRENAMSNVCSNESSCALSAIIYLSLIGKEGLRKVASLCASKAVYAKELLTQIKGVESVGNAPFFNEFVIRVPGDASEVVQRLLDKGYAAGFPLGRYYSDKKDQLLIALTEKRTKEEIKGLATAMEAVLWN